MEKLTLTTAVTFPNIVDYKILRLILDWQEEFIDIKYQANTGETKSYRYFGTQARTMMLQLNKVNLSTKSLHKRIWEQLIVDGIITGTITGSPD